ncbi:MAG: hypothetical protein ACI9D5_001235 [Candidatus Endobugula sp.]|jgi:hypothetical protein
MVIFVPIDTGVCLLQTTTSSGAKMAAFIFPQQSPISGWALAMDVRPRSFRQVRFEKSTGLPTSH